MHKEFLLEAVKSFGRPTLL